MAKNKNGLEKDKKKKLPFNVLSKKGLAALALAGVMIASPLMLAGCSGEQGPKGNDGTNGSTWYSGTEYSASQGVIGDFFFDTDNYDIYTKTADGWTWLSNIKGATGPEGPAGNDGQNGQNGQDGITPTITINEDGYWVINGVPTTTKAQGPAGENGQDGQDGQNGTTPTISINDDGYWVINGEPTDVKAEAINGTNGQDGISCYLGYDGYIWNGAERTEFSVNANLEENVVENTIGIEGIMSKYFEGSYIDLSSNTIALMANYMPNAKLTQYSGIKVTKIKVVAENAGQLYIGTAKVADIVSARSNGTTYTSSTTAYEVQAGLNTITLELNVAEDETVVLGGQGSVGLYHAQGITIDDEHGNFTLVDGSTHSEVISKTNDIQDTLAIQVSAEFGYNINTSNQTHAIEALASYTADVSTYAVSNPASAPWMYSSENSLKAYENKYLTSIRIPVVSVDTITENPVFTIRVCSYSKSGQYHVIDEDDVKVTQRLEIPVAEVANGVLDNTSAEGTTSTRGEYVVNKWITLDLSQYQIFVNEGETVVFGDVNDTVRLAYALNGDSSCYFYSMKGIPSNILGVNNHTYMADVLVIDSLETVTFEQHLEELLSKEEVAKEENRFVELQSILSGKQFSLLGDSISTYNGYCNDTDANSTLENNVFRYDDSNKATGSTVPFTSVNETWWMQTANTTTMELLVNNSWAGSEVFGERTGTNNVHIDGAWEDRCVQLHDDNGEKQGVNPDVIAVYLGINDYNFNRSNVGSGEIDFTSLITDNGDGTYFYATPTEFKDAYAIMIHKMLTKYDDAHIFIFTVLPEDMYSIDQASWNLHNKYIRDVANYFNLPIVDLAEDSGITWTNMHDYLHTDKIHPNEAGMDLITECFMNALLDHYVPTE